MATMSTENAARRYELEEVKAYFVDRFGNPPFPMGGKSLPTPNNGVILKSRVGGEDLKAIWWHLCDVLARASLSAALPIWAVRVEGDAIHLQVFTGSEGDFLGALLKAD